MLVLVAWGWAASESATRFDRHFQPAWLLLVVLPELLFGAALVAMRVRSDKPLSLRHWLMAVGVLLIAALFFPVIAHWTDYHVLNAFPR